MSLFLNRTFRYFVWFCLGCLWILGLPAMAQTHDLEIYWHEGPKSVEIGDQLATLDLPYGYLFAAAEDTQAILQYIGNPTNEHDLGLVMSANEQETWMVVYSYEPIGHVKDTQTQILDPTLLLPEIQAATIQDNQLRKTQDIPALTVTGWYQPPRYDHQHHQLSWGVTAQDSTSSMINYNIRKLGRHGVTAINLVADQTDLSSLSPMLDWLTNGYRYAEGQRYEDFVPGKDHQANLDLAALVAGSPENLNRHASILDARASWGLIPWLGLLLITASAGMGVKLGWTRYRLYRHAQAAADAFSELSTVEAAQKRNRQPLTQTEQTAASQKARQTRQSNH